MYSSEKENSYEFMYGINSWRFSWSFPGKDRSDIRYAVAGHSAYSMLAQVQREMRTCKFAGNWTPYLRTAKDIARDIARSRC